MCRIAQKTLVGRSFILNTIVFTEVDLYVDSEWICWRQMTDKWICWSQMSNKTVCWTRNRKYDRQITLPAHV